MKDDLVPFYLGQLNENARLRCEQALLTDVETLLDYLDLKRKMEAAVEVPRQPSPALWKRLRDRVPAHRQRQLAWMAGFAAAAAIAAFLFFGQTHSPTKNGGGELLFDRNSELSVRGGVL